MSGHRIKLWRSAENVCSGSSHRIIVWRGDLHHSVASLNEFGRREAEALFFPASPQGEFGIMIVVCNELTCSVHVESWLVVKFVDINICVRGQQGITYCSECSPSSSHSAGYHCVTLMCTHGYYVTPPYWVGHHLLIHSPLRVIAGLHQWNTVFSYT